MGNNENTLLKSQEEYFQNENIAFLGQEEDDFEKNFNLAFKKEEIINEGMDDYHEMENELFYIKCFDKFIQKENSQHIFSHEADFITKDDNKSIKLVNNQKSKENEFTEKIKPLESDVKENDNNKVNKIESNNNILPEQEKPNKFRVYSSKDFNLFHPWVNKEKLRQIEDLLIYEENKPIANNLFKTFQEKNKKSKKKLKEKKKRREKPDDIRKKIKSRFLKATKNRINQMLKGAKSKYFFDFLPQCFICNISKITNKAIINIPIKELMAKKFHEDNPKLDKIDKELQKKRDRDKKKHEHNVKVLKYLEKNSDICKISNFNIIGNITFKNLFNEYLKSEEFEEELKKLREENNSDKYIKDYIIKANSFINYFAKEI